MTSLKLFFFSPAAATATIFRGLLQYVEVAGEGSRIATASEGVREVGGVRAAGEAFVQFTLSTDSRLLLLLPERYRSIWRGNPAPPPAPPPPPPPPPPTSVIVTSRGDASTLLLPSFEPPRERREVSTLSPRRLPSPLEYCGCLFDTNDPRESELRRATSEGSDPWNVGGSIPLCALRS